MSFVLIHGSYISGACWTPTLPYLQGPAMAVDLPGRATRPVEHASITIDLWMRAVIVDMDAAGIESAIFVGSSFGGVVLCALAAHHPTRVKKLVFVSSIIPSIDRPIIEALNPVAQALTNGVRERGLVSSEFPAEFLPYACNDMDEAQIGFTKQQLVAEPIRPFFESVPLSGLNGDIPCVYIKLLQDQIHPPEMQDAFIASIKSCEVLTLDAGHLATISRPKELAQLLNSLL